MAEEAATACVGGRPPQHWLLKSPLPSPANGLEEEATSHVGHLGRICRFTLFILCHHTQIQAWGQRGCVCEIVQRSSVCALTTDRERG